MRQPVLLIATKISCNFYTLKILQKEIDFGPFDLSLVTCHCGFNHILVILDRGDKIHKKISPSDLTFVLFFPVLNYRTLLQLVESMFANDKILFPYFLLMVPCLS